MKKIEQFQHLPKVKVVLNSCPSGTWLHMLSCVPERHLGSVQHGSRHSMNISEAIWSNLGEVNKETKCYLRLHDVSRCDFLQKVRPWLVLNVGFGRQLSFQYCVPPLNLLVLRSTGPLEPPLVVTSTFLWYQSPCICNSDVTRCVKRLIHACFL